ncbi:MAG: hypothetical protein ACRD3N_02095 [Terracidiphilus sp.]
MKNLTPFPISNPHSAIHPLSITRRQALGGFAALAAASVLPDPRSAWGAAPAIKNPQPKPSGPVIQASLTVTSASAGLIDPYFPGLSYEKNTLYEPLFAPSNADLIGLFKRLGLGVLRIGGNSVERNVWTPNGAGQTPGQIAPGDVDALAGFVKATGWKCLYGVNLEGVAHGKTSPELAADEVAYAAKALGSSLLGIEIGNECDIYGHPHNAFAGHWSLGQFIPLWEQFRKAILAKTPGVAITGPASASNYEKWTIPFGKTVTKNEITLLTQHYYRGNGQLPTSTAEFLITPDPKLVKELAALDVAAKEIGVPYRMAECNSYYHGGANGVSDSYASSLWVIDFLFDCALGGASGINLHGGGNGGGYTPIADDRGRVVEARPEYYGLLLFTLAGQGPLHTANLDAGGLNATAYAVKSSTGGSNLVIVNKDLKQNLELTAHLPHRAHSASLLALTDLSAGAAGPELMAHSGVTIQGATVSPDGSFSPGPAYTVAVHGSEVKCWVPALSAALIHAA